MPEPAHKMPASFLDIKSDVILQQLLRTQVAFLPNAFFLFYF